MALALAQGPLPFNPAVQVPPAVPTTEPNPILVIWAPVAPIAFGATGVIGEVAIRLAEPAPDLKLVRSSSLPPEPELHATPTIPPNSRRATLNLATAVGELGPTGANAASFAIPVAELDPEPSLNLPRLEEFNVLPAMEPKPRPVTLKLAQLRL